MRLGIVEQIRESLRVYVLVLKTIYWYQEVDRISDRIILWDIAVIFEATLFTSDYLLRLRPSGY
jgi:hypothetical protein